MAEVATGDEDSPRLGTVLPLGSAVSNFLCLSLFFSSVSELFFLGLFSRTRQKGKCGPRYSPGKSQKKKKRRYPPQWRLSTLQKSPLLSVFLSRLLAVGPFVISVKMSCVVLLLSFSLSLPVSLSRCPRSCLWICRCLLVW